MEFFIVRNIPVEQCVTANKVVELLKRHVSDAQWKRASAYYLYQDNEHIRVRDFEDEHQNVWCAFEIAVTIGHNYSYRLVILPKEKSEKAQNLANEYSVY